MFGTRISFQQAIFWLAVIACCSQKMFAFDDSNLTMDDVRERINSTQGEEQVKYKLLVLTRFDFPADYRIKIADELISQGEATDNPLILGKAYCGKGTGLLHLGKLKEALLLLEQAEEFGKRCQDSDPNVFFKSRCNRAACLTMRGDQSKEAVKLLQEALAFAKPYGDQLDVPFVNTLMAHHAEKAGAIDLALKYLDSAYEGAVRSDKPILAAQAGTSVIGMLVVNAQVVEAKVWIDKLEPLLQTIRDPIVTITFAMYREDVRSAQGDPKQASENLRQIAQEAEATSNPQLIGNVYLSLAASENRAKEHENAIKSADKAIEQLPNLPRSLFLAKEHRAQALFALDRNDEALKETQEILNARESLPKVRAHELRSRVLRKLGRTDEAFEQLELCRQEEKRRLTDRAHEQATYMTAIFEDRQQIADLALAQEQSRAAEIQSELSNAVAIRQTQAANLERLIRNSVIVASLLILIGCVLLFRMIANRKTASALAAQEHQLNLELKESLARQTAILEGESAKRRKLEIAVERKHRDETIGKLTGGVAHDFNNLLTVILQSLELAKLIADPLPPKVSRLLDGSINAAESGASIVRQLLAYARQQPLSPKPICVSAWLASTLGMFQQIGGKRVRIDQCGSTQNTTISADSAQLTTSVINLIANARDAIDVNHGEIELCIKTISLDESSVAEWMDVSPGQYVLFEVRDNGSGMSPEQLSHACEPFYSTKSPTAGTGLGLSSVLGFVKQSAGDLKIASAPEVGTTVSFILPTVDPIAPDAVSVDPSLGVRHPRQSVLLVEDQDEVRNVIGLSLKTMGLDVIEAANADEAVEIMGREDRPQCVLSDVRMPGSMNGIELRRWILSRFGNVRVILMSGFQDIETELAPGTVFIPKPVKQADLRQAIEAL